MLAERRAAPDAQAPGRRNPKSVGRVKQTVRRQGPGVNPQEVEKTCRGHLTAGVDNPRVMLPAMPERFRGGNSTRVSPENNRTLRRMGSSGGRESVKP
jgi:hypothetical protein